LLDDFPMIATTFSGGLGESLAENMGVSLAALWHSPLRCGSGGLYSFCFDLGGSGCHNLARPARLWISLTLFPALPKRKLAKSCKKGAFTLGVISNRISLVRITVGEWRGITRPHLTVVWNRAEQTGRRKQVRTPRAPSSGPAYRWQHGTSDIKERSTPMIGPWRHAGSDD
jgi:hypothetical protein